MGFIIAYSHIWTLGHSTDSGLARLAEEKPVFKTSSLPPESDGSALSLENNRNTDLDPQPLEDNEQAALRHDFVSHNKPETVGEIQKENPIITRVSADKLIDFARTLEGQVLETRIRKSHFKVLVTRVGMDYTPLSTGKARPQYYKVIKKICDHFSETNSYAGIEYKSFTANSTYVLTLIDMYINR